MFFAMIQSNLDVYRSGHDSAVLGMSSFELEEPWGQLVSVNLAREERIPIVGNEFTIGRGKSKFSINNESFFQPMHTLQTLI